MKHVAAAPCTFVWAVVAAVLLAGAARAAAGPITVAWDPSPAPDITHYRVYVSRVPGMYREFYDVSPYQTSFVYQAPLDGVSYYFTVAAVRSFVVGPRSAEVLAVSSGPRAVVLGDVGGAEAIAASRMTAPSAGCTDRARCSSVAARRGLGAISAIAATGDGRLLLVEDGRAVRVQAEDGALSDPALEVSGQERSITALAVDPRFAATRAVLVGEVVTRPEGRRFSVSRYRELGGTLGDRAVVVDALPLPTEGDAQLGMDAAGFVYIALPAPSPASSGATSRGSVLRFALDGTVPRENPGGTPEFAPGPAAPRALLPVGRDEMWVIGNATEARWLLSSAGVPVSGSAARLARSSADPIQGETISAAASSDPTTGEPRFYTVDADGALWRSTVGEVSSRVELGLSGAVVTRVAAEPGGRLYVAVRAGDSSGSGDVSWILRLAVQ